MDDVYFTGAAVILREHGFDVLADEITTMWTASRATVHGQATRIMELEEERAGLYRSLSESQAAAAPPLAVDRERLAKLLRDAHSQWTPVAGRTFYQFLADALVSAGVRGPVEQQDGAGLIVAEIERLKRADRGDLS